MPIIDPMYLYLIEVLHNIDVLNQGLFIMLTLVICGFFAMWLADDEIRELSKPHKGKVISLCIAFVISALIALLIPTKDAMYKMLIASYVTTDNIQIVNEAIKTNLQDYLNMLGETVKNMR
jgi:hypothetical protein